MKLLSKIILLSVIISSLSIKNKKIIVPINKFSEFKTSKVCLKIGDQIELKESENSDIYVDTFLVDTKVINAILNQDSGVYTAEKEGKCHFTLYRKEDEIKKAFYLLVDYFNLLRFKKYLKINVSNEDNFLESECDNSRFETKILNK